MKKKVSKSEAHNDAAMHLSGQFGMCAFANCIP
jgi:hypothetical protein